MATASTPAKPLSVSRFEAALLRLLRGILQPIPGQTPPLPVARMAIPGGLSPECLYLAKDSLAKGCVQYLARAGGWRCDRFLRSGQPALGRLWQRSGTDQLALAFSPHSMAFLVWLTAGRPEKANNWDPPSEALTPADKFLLFLAYDALRGTEAAQALRHRSALARHGLIHLFFPDDFAELTVKPTIDFATWLDGVGACILEALQSRLQGQWLEQERAKGREPDWRRLRHIGAAQEQCLSAFLDEAEAARRPDLARFLLKALAELLSPDLTPAFWIGGLKGNGPPRLAERLETQRQGLAVLRQLERLGEWTRRARATGFLDDDYAIWQMWLADWEQHRGDELAGIAHNLLRQLEPLRIQASPAWPPGQTARNHGDSTH